MSIVARSSSTANHQRRGSEKAETGSSQVGKTRLDVAKLARCLAALPERERRQIAEGAGLLRRRLEDMPCPYQM